MKAKWIAACKRLKVDTKSSLWIPSINDVLCSKHFTQQCFTSNLKRNVLKAFAVPTIFSFTKPTSSLSSRALRYTDSYANLPLIVNEATTSKTEDYERRLAKYKDNLRNAKKREKRLRTTVESLKNELKEANMVKQSLEEKLDAFKGNFTL